MSKPRASVAKRVKCYARWFHTKAGPFGGGFVRGGGRVSRRSGGGGRSGDDVQGWSSARFSDTLYFGTVFSSVWTGALGPSAQV